MGKERREVGNTPRGHLGDPNLTNLIESIKLEEKKLGVAEQWTPEEVARLKKIRDMRHTLPRNEIVAARGQLGELFHLPRRK